MHLIRICCFFSLLLISIPSSVCALCDQISSLSQFLTTCASIQFDNDDTNFNLLYRLAIDTSSFDILNSTSLTFFAPSDAAFKESVSDISLLLKLKQPLPTSEEDTYNFIRKYYAKDNQLLKTLFEYHLVKGSYTLNQLREQSQVLTLAKLPFLISGTTIKDNEQRLTDPSISFIAADHPAGISMLHAVDRLLLPFPINSGSSSPPLPSLSDNPPSPISPGQPSSPIPSTNPSSIQTPIPIITPPPSSSSSTNDKNNNQKEKENSKENSKENENSKPACFPSSSNVHLQDGSLLPIHKLKAGHHIMSSQSISSKVFLFSHKQPYQKHNFIRLITESSYAISLTSGHYIYANNQLIAAKNVQIGDNLKTLNGFSKVIKILNIQDFGLYAPHTLHGDIVIDGIIASTYTTAIHPQIAHTILTPFRLLVSLRLVVEPIGSLLYNGAEKFSTFLSYTTSTR